jgi:hypothetical protein
MIPINVGDTIQVSFGPHQAASGLYGGGPTTANVTAVDNFRRQLVVTHLTGPLVGKPGMIHLDHARALTDSFAPRPVGTLWQ